MNKLTMYGLVLLLGVVAIGQETHLYNLSGNSKVTVSLTEEEVELIKLIRLIKKEKLEHNEDANKALYEKIDKNLKSQGDVINRDSINGRGGGQNPGV